MYITVIYLNIGSSVSRGYKNTYALAGDVAALHYKRGTGSREVNGILVRSIIFGVFSGVVISVNNRAVLARRGVVDSEGCAG